ncbi:MAG: hypothetical protein VXZ78_04740, partial [Pseudomonadota bacterium]|nr:hypothetical protein [Pseudomonadota bacterium]
ERYRLRRCLRRLHCHLRRAALHCAELLLEAGSPLRPPEEQAWERAEAAGTKAELQIWDDMPHVHQIAFRMVPEARAALKDIARFFKGAMA